MKPGQLILGLLIGIVLGAFGGYFFGRACARAALRVGPYSDNYGPALLAISEAKTRIEAGNTNVLKQLTEAESQIGQAQRWTRRFLGQQGAANGSLPIRSETNRTSSAAGPRR